MFPLILTLILKHIIVFLPKQTQLPFEEKKRQIWKGIDDMIE